MLTVRETVATWINTMPALQALGMYPDQVYQADAADNIKARPFVVVRWLEELPGVGSTTRRPFDLWLYDDKGDYSRIERMGRAVKIDLLDRDQVQVEGGWITQIIGGTRGRDMVDEGYNAAVIPYSFQAIASGV